MKRDDDQKDNSRREFLRKTAAAGAGAAAAVTLPGVAVAGVPDTQQPSDKKGYRLTRHIVDYYKTAAE